MATKYLCENPACVLGVPGQPGRFSGGITSEQLHLLTGRPADELVEGEDYGDGFCPNCGHAGKEEK